MIRLHRIVKKCVAGSLGTIGFFTLGVGYGILAIAVWINQ
jgi:hypothetical protein